MKKKSFFLIILLFLSIIFTQNIYVFAVLEDDKMDFIWLEEEILKTVSSNVTIDEIKLSSKFAVALDRESKSIIWGKNENNKTPMASTTKIMTSIILIENGDLNKTIEVCKKAANTGGSRLGLKEGDKITLNDLLYGLMLCSGNDAAVQIAMEIGGDVIGFADLMNKKAKELNLKNTNFVTPHGLDEDEHYTTAYELAKIADYALNIEKIANVVKTKQYTVMINGYPKTISNTNELLGYLDGVNGVKTGFTNNAGRCLVTSVNRNGFNIITVVLGADTKRIRTSDSIKLIESVYSDYKLIDLKKMLNEEFNNWEKMNKEKININKGIKNYIKIGIEKNDLKNYPIKKDDLDNIKMNIYTINNLDAPVYVGEKVGEVVVMINNKIIVSLSITTQETIIKKQIKNYMLDFFKKYNKNIENGLFVNSPT